MGETALTFKDIINTHKSNHVSDKHPKSENINVNYLDAWIETFDI